MMSNAASTAVRATRKKDSPVTLVEVSPRDGLPEVCHGLSTEDNINYINKLSETGLKKIECASFIHPRLMPEGYDAENSFPASPKNRALPTWGSFPMKSAAGGRYSRRLMKFWFCFP